MNANDDRLDVAIDAVAARLTEVAGDDGLALRIVNSLPERSTWLAFGWKSRFAVVAIALAAMVGVVRQSFYEGSTEVLRTFDARSTDVQLAAVVPEHRTYVEPSPIVRRTIVDPPSNDRRTTMIDVPDFDRSLPALEAPSVLTLDSLAPVSLPEDAPLTLKALEIADLPLTADSFSPR